MLLLRAIGEKTIKNLSFTTAVVDFTSAVVVMLCLIYKTSQSRPVSELLVAAVLVLLSMQ